jgi:hypothetical protein
VTQDEPVETGSHSPDAVFDGSDLCELRAERAGTGNGRVYTIWYTASDGRGGECSGSVQVCVPHDRKHLDCIDDGPAAAEVRPHSLGGPADVGSGHSFGRLMITETSIAGNRATVKYTLPSASEVQLSLYDVAGRRVAAIESGARAEGAHQVVWSIAGLPRGIYFYRLRSSAGVITQTVLIR